MEQFQFANYSSPNYANTGVGSLKFKLLNQRHDIAFGFFSGGLENVSIKTQLRRIIILYDLCNLIKKFKFFGWTWECKHQNPTSSNHYFIRSLQSYQEIQFLTWWYFPIYVVDIHFLIVGRSEIWWHCWCLLDKMFWKLVARPRSNICANWIQVSKSSRFSAFGSRKDLEWGNRCDSLDFYHALTKKIMFSILINVAFKLWRLVSWHYEKLTIVISVIMHWWRYEVGLKWVVSSHAYRLWPWKIGLCYLDDSDMDQWIPFWWSNSSGCLGSHHNAYKAKNTCFHIVF